MGLVEIGIVAFIAIWAIGALARHKPMVCTQCEITDYPRHLLPGHFLVEVLLWILFIIPGVIYSLWRHVGRRIPECRHCGGRTMVPLASPAGRRIRDRVD